MKNQSFHPRKIRIQETPKPSYDELKTRTVNALNKLGQQTFSTESGGYSLDNWVRGVNLLLDGFEEEVGKERLSPAYLEKRRLLNDSVSRPVSTSSIDEEISDLRRKIANLDGKMSSERTGIASRLSDLRDEQSRCAAELAQEKDRVSSQEAAQNSDSIFRRLLRGKSKPAANEPETRTKELESKLVTLSSEILEQQKLLKSVDQSPAESPLAEVWNELKSLQARLDALEGERLQMVQLVKEREEITASMANEISAMTPSEPKPS
jgi:chromosome segregation ATPase